MNKVQAKRLLKLADFLETVPRKEFDYGTYGVCQSNGCGTSACALGWAPSVPAFKRLGLTSNFLPDYEDGPLYQSFLLDGHISGVEQVSPPFRFRPPRAPCFVRKLRAPRG